MREIKFRAWDNENKTMADNRYILNYCNSEWTLAAPNPYPDHELIAGEDVELNDYTAIEDFEVIQFTGRIDKHSNQIWEGDIVRYFNSMDACVVVEWWKKLAMFAIEWRSKKLVSLRGC